MKSISLLLLLSVCSFCLGNKYSAEKNSPDYQKLLTLENPFRMQKLNMLWDRAVKKLPSAKLKQFYTDLKFQDKEELALKKLKAEGSDKQGIREGITISTFKAILERYGLTSDFQAIQETSKDKTNEKDILQDDFSKSVFRDKKLNKLWLKAEKQGFSEIELNTLKEEFQHHQNKIDQYYAIINNLHDKKVSDENILDNTVENVLAAEVGEKLWKTENAHQTLKEKHSELKAGYDHLNSKIYPSIKNHEFEEPMVNILWDMTKNSTFTDKELESLKGELHHYEHRVKKLRILESDKSDDDDNDIPEVAAKKHRKIKELERKVLKIQKELSDRILQKHSEL